MSRAPTMIDVAREARVALRTVSRFVNGATNIDPVLAARVQEAITLLGYRRNVAAASIRPGWSSKTLGLVIGDLANPYYSVLARAIERYARVRGYLLISASSDEDGGQHDLIVDRLMEQRVDALLIVPPRNTARSWSQVIPPIPPVVFLDRPADFAGADTVLADNAGGAFAATQQLVSSGATKVAFLGDALDIHTMFERLRGYRKGLSRAGINYDESIVLSSAHSSEDAAALVRTLLEVGAIDAVFAANNRAAVGALIAFRDVGRRVPLIGFDDFEAALLGDPPVSVVSQDVSEMGSRAAELAIDRLANPDRASQTIVLPTKLVLRGSES